MQKSVRRCVFMYWRDRCGGRRSLQPAAAPLDAADDSQLLLAWVRSLLPQKTPPRGRDSRSESKPAAKSPFRRFVAVDTRDLSPGSPDKSVCEEDGSVTYCNLQKASNAWLRKHEAEVRADGGGAYLDRRFAMAESTEPPVESPPRKPPARRGKPR